jgi:hypothetical protein
MIKTGPVRGDFPSLKLRRMVGYGSTIERDLLYFLEYWESVTWYQEQPMTIAREMADGHVRHYTPDYEIHEGTVKSIAECKPEARMESEHAQQQRRIGQSWAEENGYCFVTFTETELRTGFQLDNVRLLWRYARLQVPCTIQDSILSVVNTPQTRCTIIGLCRELNLSSQDVVPVVCHLLFHHRLQMDLAQPFSITTVIWLIERQKNGTN